jgi:glycosyltransferase involved in cell wall biosynthesis
MKVLYLLPILPPKLSQAEALLQEISLLRRMFTGDIIYLNPNAALPVPLPRLFFGLHLLPTLWRRERMYDLIHFYNPDPFPFPVLRLLKKPVVYSLLGGVGERPLHTPFFSSLAAVTVSDERSQQRLQAWGLRNIHLVHPGIETQRFTYHPLSSGETIHLLMASAPWTLDQFRSKGIESLLEAARC